MKNWIEDRFTKSNHKTSKKDNKLPIINLGTHKKRTVILWIIFMAGFIFAVYKNFTAINIHTVHEKAIIKEEVVDTSDIQSFATDFIKTYYTWENNREYLLKRSEKLKSFLTEELIELNADTIRSDIPTSSKLTDIKIWEVKDITKENEQGKTYNLIFGIEQLITDTDIQPTESSSVNETTDEVIAESGADSTASETISESESSNSLQEQNQVESSDSQANLENTGGTKTEQLNREKLINSTYSIEIYVDGNKNMVITKNPTMSAGFTKSAYEPKPKENIAIDNDKQAEILEFL